MADWIAVASGKGGVGKTTVAVNLATVLAMEKKEVVLLDANLCAPCVGLHLGSTEVPKSLHHVLRGEALLDDAVYRHPSGFKVIPGTVSYSIARSTPFSDWDVSLSNLSSHGNTIIIDTPEGVGRETEEALRLAHGVIAVTTPDIPSVVGTLKLLRLAEDMGKTVHGVVVNKWRADSCDLPLDNIRHMLEREIIAVIPYHDSARQSVRNGHPVAYAYPNSPTSRAFRELGKKLSGTENSGWWKDG